MFLWFEKKDLSISVPRYKGVLQKAGAWQPILTRATYSAGGAAVRDKQFFKNLPQ
jgi:hypothetical protein